MKGTVFSLAILAVSGALCAALFYKGHVARGETQKAPVSATPNAWTATPSRPALRFRDVQFLDERNGWGVTKDGIWHTTDAGRNWSEVRKGPTETNPVMTNSHLQMIPEQVEFLSTVEGWVVEGDYLIHTTDGGVNWEKRTFENAIITACFFLDRRKGWCVGQRMQLPPSKEEVETWHKVIYWTGDAGASWRRCYEEEADDPYPLHGVWANSIEDIWAVGGPLRSTDSGHTWRKIEITNWKGVGGGPVSISFLDNLVGWITTNGPGGYLYTSDGGTVWEPRPAPEGFNGSGARPLVYTSPDEAWAPARGGVYHSGDTGITWTRVLGGDYDGVAFVRDKGLLIAIGKEVATRRIGS